MRRNSRRGVNEVRHVVKATINLLELTGKDLHNQACILPSLRHLQPRSPLRPQFHRFRHLLHLHTRTVDLLHLHRHQI